MQGRTRVGEGKKDTVGWDVVEWDIGTCRDATVMIEEKRTLHERTRDVTQGSKDETCKGGNIEK